MDHRRYILPIIVLSQFAGTSVWFAGNAVIGDVIKEFSLDKDVLSSVVTAVQLGFISGTLLFALLNIADRFSPSKIFFLCTIGAALANVSILLATGFNGIIVSRVITGFFLAGIYPVGMKIASDHHKEGLGKAMGYLVGALVLGTSFPHLLHGLGTQYDWRFVIGVVSALAALGGLMIFLFVPDGPHRTKATSPDFKLIGRLFRNKDFRSAAFGYFGHMWELYTFWALVPTILAIYMNRHPGITFNIPLTSFAIIAMGSIGCVTGGHIALRKGSNPVAFIALLVSFICCLSAYFIFGLPLYIFMPVLLLWAMTVIADSPQFTTMVAQSVAVHEKGTALLITNSIGFSLTIVSIQFITKMQQLVGEDRIYFLLAAGPLLGLLSMRYYKKKLIKV